MIRGKKILLRTLREKDLSTYLEIISDLSQFSPYWPANLYSESYLRKEFEDNGFWKEDYRLLLITDHKGNYIGEVDAFKTSPNIQGVEVGYRIFNPDNMGKGYMTEALQLFTAYLFQTNASWPRLTVLIRSDNAGSIRVAEKCGFQREGTLRNACLGDGKLHSYEMLSLLKEECPKLFDLMQRE
ncbi:MAG: GNAT family N-acetyltransferase [Opitutales bacterium]|nr:GNAT family N-acetyltransferase [Opitutales bacterium]